MRNEACRRGISNRSRRQRHFSVSTVPGFLQRLRPGTANRPCDRVGIERRIILGVAVKRGPGGGSGTRKRLPRGLGLQGKPVFRRKGHGELGLFPDLVFENDQALGADPMTDRLRIRVGCITTMQRLVDHAFALGAYSNHEASVRKIQPFPC